MTIEQTFAAWLEAYRCFGKLETLDERFELARRREIDLSDELLAIEPRSVRDVRMQLYAALLGRVDPSESPSDPEAVLFMQAAYALDLPLATDWDVTAA